MAKGDDIVRRKKNKANRKKLNKQDSSNVSTRVASLIAAKKRRKAGKRRLCQGMCFSLPTPDDPFNDQHGKNLGQRETTKGAPLRVDKKVSIKRNNDVIKKSTVHGNNVKVDELEPIKEVLMTPKDESKCLIASTNCTGQTVCVNSGMVKNQIHTDGKVGLCSHQEKAYENSDCPSKYLIMCLKAIEGALDHDGSQSSVEGKLLFVNAWGVEFWKCYASGNDILETSGASSDIEQIAWIVSTAADTIAKREKEGLSFTSPFLLFLVPSKEKAVQVRMVCKSLKVLGIHTVSLHSGASLEHQICGLKSCEPEFLVCTPERLLELVSLNAIDVSGVSVLVIDGMGSPHSTGYLDSVKSIKQAISGKPQTVLFNDCLGSSSSPTVQNLLRGPVCKLSKHDSVVS